MGEMQYKNLIDRIKKGDTNALEELYDQFAPILLVISMRYLSNREDAEDVLHDAFIKIISGLKSFDPKFEGALEAWMKKIIVNTSINFLKIRQKNKKMTNSLDNNLFTDEVSQDDKLNSLSKDIKPEKVIEMIQYLPDGYRTVLNLFVFENYSHKEISTTLGISENTSKSQLSKARTYLKKKMSETSKKEQMIEYEKIG